jgi:hypothetical protein
LINIVNCRVRVVAISRPVSNGLTPETAFPLAVASILASAVAPVAALTPLLISSAAWGE